MNSCCRIMLGQWICVAEHSKVFCFRGASIKLKKAAAKYGFCVPIKPNPSIFQRINSDKDKIEISETAGIYKLNFTNENNEKMLL